MTTQTNTDFNQIMQIGNERVVGGWKIYVGHFGLQVTEITNAGRKGKKCAKFSVCGEGWNDDLAWASIGTDLSVIAQSKTLTADAMEEEIKGISAKAYAKCRGSESWGVMMSYRNELRGIDVPLAPIVVHNKTMYLEADGVDVLVRNLTDQHNEPTTIITKKNDARKFYDYVSAHSANLSEMTYHQVTSLMLNMGLKIHSYCAVD